MPELSELYQELSRAIEYALDTTSNGGYRALGELVAENHTTILTALREHEYERAYSSPTQIPDSPESERA